VITSFITPYTQGPTHCIGRPDFVNALRRHATMPFTALTDEGEKELYRLQRLYWRALRCEEAKAYLAG
jgi:hypothetical protein